MEKTYLFYDIETTGLNKCFDQIIQFAAIRTDLTLNELERHEYFIKLNPDVVPSPQAFITHRIPLKALSHGMSELEAMNKIHSLFNKPGTISLGYNTLGFDDEFLRFSFYRNLLPPYSHQYANQCSRLDLYPITVVYSLYKKDLLSWPENNLKLENISAKNDLAQGAAHNAMTDVTATLNLARKLQNDLKTWNYLTGCFDKRIDLERCSQIQNLATLPAAILIDGKFGFEQQYQCAVTPLGNHQHYKNQMLWLRIDNLEIEEISPENFIEKSWVINKKMGEPGIILPMNQRFLRSYLNSKEQKIAETLNWLKKNDQIYHTIRNYYLNYTYPKVQNIDVCASLYENGFMSDFDEKNCLRFQSASPSNKLIILKSFSKTYLQKLALRIVGHYFGDILDDEHQVLYQEYLQEIALGNLQSVDYKGQFRLTPKQAQHEIDSLLKQAIDSEQKAILGELSSYIQQHFKMGISA